MATFDYAKLQATANRLITKFGQTGAVKRETLPDPVYGGAPTVTSYTATLVPMSYDQKYVDGANITTADRKIYISSVGLAITPRVGDIVTVAGVNYSVVAADPNNYDGVTNVVFIVQGRIVA